MTEEKNPKRQPTPLWKRLPFIVVGVLGIWLWQGGGDLVPVERQVVWKVPGAYASVRRVQAELWRGEELLTRIEIEAPQGLTLDPQKALPLKQGRYRSQLRVWRQGAPEPELESRNVEVGEAATVVIER